MELDIEKWSIISSVVILVSVLIYILWADFLVITTIAFVGFIGTVYIARGSWTPDGGFGKANIVTSLRLIMLFFTINLLEHIDQTIAAGIFLAIILTDKLDGILARRNNETSEFGSLYDNEVDAYLIFILCLVIIDSGIVSNWLILIGCLRYVYVITLSIIPTEPKPERRSLLSATIGTTLAITLVIVYSELLPIVANQFLIIVSIAVCYTFARDFIYRTDLG